MGARTDAALALLVLAAVASFAVRADVTPAPVFLVVGGAATVTFELLAAREYETVRQYWDRRSVQLTSLAAAIGGAAVGTRVAPVLVLSLCSGATITYLGFLALRRTGIVPPPQTWW
ncbi:MULTISPECIES: hypothetical protein [Natrinema]|uniref:Uncharacterized protein n=2 Tax=Natrinema TaxID=88723 RepID=L9Z6T6_9EURY|nr:MULTISPECIES: hypothetical protein [Natrinema]AFO57705.1 hypothetical protein NJ7G_2474 [Natrinema sp. J7-2]ELY80913.1 hypothetical protein C486_08370 [Natrinema gari JCM 14663]